MKTFFNLLAIVILTILFSHQATANQNLILISVDTLRQDHLGIYGYKRNTSPNIDRLLRRGVYFTNAHCNVPLTSPSFASLMTSRYPHETGSTRNGVPMIDGIETLAEILKKNGYATSAFLSNWPLKKHISNLQKGFDIYDDNFFEKRWIFFNSERDAEEVTRLAISWLESRRREPFFLWAHYSDPHSPYLFHKGFIFREAGKPDSDEQRKIDAYDSEIAYTDRQIGILLDKIYEMKLEQRSLLVFLADHGESLGEHCYFGHGRYIYDDSMRIPFGFSGPGIAVNRRLEFQVELLDFAPTVLGYLGIEPGQKMRGRNLVSFIRGEKGLPKSFLVYYETYPGAVRGEGAEKLVNTKKPIWVGFKLDEVTVLYSVINSRWEMYNLKKDPKEIKNLADPANPVFIRYSEHLLKWYKSWEQEIATGRTDAMTEADRERLEALGYLNK